MHMPQHIGRVEATDRVTEVAMSWVAMRLRCVLFSGALSVPQRFIAEDVSSIRHWHQLGLVLRASHTVAAVSQGLSLHRSG